MSLAIKSARVANRGPAIEQGGFLGDLFGGIKGAVTGGVGSLISGGNPIAGAVRGGIRGYRGSPSAPPPMGMSVLPGGMPAGPGFPGGPVLAGGSGTGLMKRGSFAVSPAGTKIACPSGTHPNKSSYFLSDGSFVAEGSRCVKNRRRNPMNPRALGRAISRVEAGKKWQQKLAGITTEKYTSSGKRKDC